MYRCDIHTIVIVSYMYSYCIHIIVIINQGYVALPPAVGPSTPVVLVFPNYCGLYYPNCNMNIYCLLYGHYIIL